MEKNELLGTYEQNPYAAGAKRYGFNAGAAATSGPVDKTGYVERDAQNARMQQAQQQMRPAVMPPSRPPAIGRGIPGPSKLTQPAPKPQKPTGLPTNGKMPIPAQPQNPMNNPALRKNVYSQWLQDNLGGAKGSSDALRRGF
jgi:hypothetical protein